ncbi:MAG: hypothetical protein ACREMU_06210 [Gemmatimonadaceae bacterium]
MTGRAVAVLKRAGPGVAGIIVVVLVAVGIYRYVYTPTATLYVQNDTSHTIVIAVCASDVLTVSAGGKTPIDPNTDDPGAGCTIYDRERNGDRYVGCLPVSTTKYRGGDTVPVSRLRRQIPSNSCGD